MTRYFEPAIGVQDKNHSSYTSVCRYSYLQENLSDSHKKYILKAVLQEVIWPGSV